jgi:hypothetical protein
VLEAMGIPIPEPMTGRTLVRSARTVAGGINGGG